ncbi:MAG: hypothetical protein A2355_08280 [Spirochaetes bacterium RIFOXYB1_FULL_32_8]|nr:MAG: hypothetical protein A2Y29_01550 [Spirochaetes bacterium GWE2_31_10]OHD78244.1 MAG: hypothetical protein A2355_08280 [Spirochaetes bacterium RIFOXYB1_FULL_32_8]HBD94626.1 DNA-binding protein [Spirochaetia bacterium]HBI39258.1 DNA-binding protein [Spirochaetia bacterium]
MEKKFYTAKEAACFVSVSVKMIYKMVENKKIPYTKIGSKVLIPVNDFETWLNANTHKIEL